MKEYSNKGISLLVLIVTVIVIIILVGTAIITLSNGNIIDKSKKAKFMSDYRTVQEAVGLYSASKYNETTGQFDLPLNGELTQADKEYIKNNVSTLNTKIEELSGSIDTANLAWISSVEIGVKLSSEKQAKGYIIDLDTKQIYDYIGDVFEGQRWHTLDGGVSESPDGIKIVSQELWDGWIKLTLYYPAGSTAKQWRLGTEGELRVDPMLMWQEYTGPITVPMDRIKDVWIKYILNNKVVTIPPAGTLLVDIIPDKTGTTKVSEVNVSINYDETATTKEYRVGDSGWMIYTAPFTVTENCVVEARASKVENIYNTDGTFLSSRNISGKDMVYIGNIGIEETTLAAPTITRLSPSNGTEKARVQITYPAEASKKIYKINYGVEENYTSEISIVKYGTYIIAYYYDTTGKRSQASGIYINDTTTGAVPEPPVPYDPDPPYDPDKPIPPGIIQVYSVIPAPTINVSPTSLVDAVQVSVVSPADADKVYIKLGRYAEYQEYTGPIMVRKNMEVYSYYRTYTGERSSTAYKVVSNIKQTNKPYVYIDANPYPWGGSYGASEVAVTINYSDCNTIEYSEDGIVYKPYTAPFTVTKNEMVYARGTNAYGVSETSLNITNIGKLIPPSPITNLAVDINVNPEPSLSTTRVAKATVTIDYDSKATEKYYCIGRYGSLKTYTGAFDVTSSCTIYAYAKGTNAEGSDSKIIDNISDGISEPVIISTPNNSIQSSKVSIDISYDKYATIKRYSINGGSLIDYTGAFDISTNGSVIYAYSQNALGQKSESSYTIQNIVPEPPMLLLDKGSYYLLKLNYPPESKTREYKWKVDGVWKIYNEAGILLVKGQYKDQLIQNGTLVKIEDENGNMVTFSGDYYVIDVPINELSENLFMRWDREPLAAPQIIINPTTATRQVTATIVYNPALIKKQYRIIDPDGKIGTWIDYTGPITIDRKNTVIVANGMDETEVWTPDAMKKITNIDETAPVIKLTADLSAAQQKVAVKVSVTDDIAVGKVKWASGTQGESYFTNAGTEIINDSIVNITSNGYYTFYAEDQVGNKQVYTLNVTNVDLTPPAIDIAVSPEIAVGLSANVTINYGDSTIKQYKVGTSNSTWTNYTAPFGISSYTILSNNYQNADGTVTIYAKGKDAVGNEITVQKKVVSLDLDMPASPVVNSNAGYPTLSEYGVIYNGATTITYDSRTDINNYYSIDNGTTWLPYVGQFDVISGTVIAKSVKKNSGLEVTVSRTIAMPSDAIKPQAYDGDDSTYTMPVADIRANIDSSLLGKNLRIKWHQENTTRLVRIRFLDANNNEISQFKGIDGINDMIITIPMGSKYIKFTTDWASEAIQPFNKLYEIQVSNEPTFTAVNMYPLLHADPTKSEKYAYQNVSINYFPTSVQRFYKIGSTGTWINYADVPIRVNQGEIIYAKGIDKNGKETRIISNYTSNVSDAVKKEAFDGNIATNVSPVVNIFTQVDSSIYGKNIRVVWYQENTTRLVRIRFLDASYNEISQTVGVNGLNDRIIVVPNGTKYIKFTTDYISESANPFNKLYEIQVANEPTYTATNGYPFVHVLPDQWEKAPYQNVTINYFGTSVQKLYKIGTTGTWQNYVNTPVKVIQNQTLYAKGIDQYGNETRIISSYTANVPDAVKQEAFDGNTTTYVSPVVNLFVQVDSSMYDKTIRVIWYQENTTRLVRIRFLNSSYIEISQTTGTNGTNNKVITIPTGTKFIKFTTDYSGEFANPYNKLYEIQP